MDNAEITQIHCNRCGHETKHQILAKRETSDSANVEGVGKIWWEDVYEMLECCGCESVALRHKHWFSDTDELTVRYYPPRVSRSAPKWKSKLPHKLRSLLDEVYTALHADSRRLATMGARTVVDMVILDKVGDVGTFQEKLKKLEDQGFIGKLNRDYLSAALDAGSAAAHRGYLADADEVNHVMDIVENLLEAVYVLEKAANNLRRSTPPRRPRP